MTSQRLIHHIILGLAIGIFLPACGEPVGNDDDSAGDDDDAAGDDDDATGDDDDATGDDDDATGDDDDDDDDDDVAQLYAYDSKINAGESSVSYSGQTFRHTLLSEMTTYMKGLTDAANDANSTLISAPDAANPGSSTGLLFYYDFGATVEGHPAQGAAEVALESFGDAALLQTTYKDLKDCTADITKCASLRQKTAGYDSSTDHLDWDEGTTFQGWDGLATNSPIGLLNFWWGLLDQEAWNWVDTNTRSTDQWGNPVQEVFLTGAGHDLTQLTQKFLLGALMFSQAADDYTSSDVDGKGLLAGNGAIANDDGTNKNYTGVEHAWDEAFGYFGASRHYIQLTDSQIKGNDLVDADGDGLTNLGVERQFGASINAAKRDAGAQKLVDGDIDDEGNVVCEPNANAVATDFTRDAWVGFTAGRQYLADTTAEELTQDDIDVMNGFRAEAIGAWEHAIAATVVHYINDTLIDLNSWDAANDGSAGDQADWYADYAKHWSELKGFALGMQFNPSSPLLAEFANFHSLVGDAPVLPDGTNSAAVDTYKADLVSARNILRDAYGFADANMGDSNGDCGW